MNQYMTAECLCGRPKDRRALRCASCERPPIETRLWATVDKNGPLHPALGTQCWIWTAGTLEGYGRLKTRGVRILAHRLAWEITNGPIPDGLMVLHRCDNPPCVNPAHLFLGTQRDNVADRHAKGRTRGPGQPKVAA